MIYRNSYLGNPGDAAQIPFLESPLKVMNPVPPSALQISTRHSRQWHWAFSPSSQSLWFITGMMVSSATSPPHTGDKEESQQAQVKGGTYLWWKTRKALRKNLAPGENWKTKTEIVDTQLTMPRVWPVWWQACCLSCSRGCHLCS